MQILLVDWGDVYTDADGDAFTVLMGGPAGLAENGALSVGDATNRTLAFTPAPGAKAAKFSIRAQDIKGGDSGVAQISLTFGELSARARRLGTATQGPACKIGLCARAPRNAPLDSPSYNAGGGALLPKLVLESVTTARSEAASAPTAKPRPSRTRAGAAGACSGVQATKPLTLTVTAGTAQVQVNTKGRVKTIGAPLGVWLDMLPAGAAANATADAACHIKVAGGIKAGATRERTVAAKKLTACYAALKLADCSKPLQARATAVTGKKYKQGLASKVVIFTPACAPC
jgi:hypothetical protein